MASQRARLSEEFLRGFRVDTRSFRVRSQGSWVLKKQEEKGYSSFYDEWGIGRKLAKDRGMHFFIFHHPLSEVETSDLSRFPWPDPMGGHRLIGVAEEARVIRQEADPAFVLGSSFSSGLLQFAAQLEGHERSFTDLLLDPKRTEWILDKIHQLKLNLYRYVLDRAGDWVDIFF